jgi:hypothetical protein
MRPTLTTQRLSPVTDASDERASDVPPRLSPTLARTVVDATVEDADTSVCRVSVRTSVVLTPTPLARV